MDEEENKPANIPKNESPEPEEVKVIQENDSVSTEGKNIEISEATSIEQITPDTEIQTEKMEAHHHPHVHHSRKWKDYLFEFIMLFLAVTAGFVVENIREHYIENKRVEQYSRHLLADLRLDSLFFENRNRDIQSRLVGHDKLQFVLIQKSGATDKEILESLLPVTYAYDLPVTTTTYNQMKTSGSLRYVNNLELTAVLQNYYDVLLPRCIKLTEASLSYFSQHVNNFYLEHIRIQDFDPFNDTLINTQPQIINRTSQTNQQLANIMGGFRSLLTIQAITMNDPALKKIKEIIQLLKAEYDLD